MLAVVSPAKSLNFEMEFSGPAKIEPRFLKETAELSKVAAKLSRKKLQQLMSISPTLADSELSAISAFRGRRDAGYGDARQSLPSAATPISALMLIQRAEEASLDLCAGSPANSLRALWSCLRPLGSVSSPTAWRWAPSSSTNAKQQSLRILGDQTC